MEKAKELLKKYFGYENFRNSQIDIINSILKKQNTIGIMPTGGGKSICYQIPALIFEGITIVISPLISLMKDQVDSLVEAGIESVFINSSISQNEINKKLIEIENKKYKLVYIAPERLDSINFISSINRAGVAMVVIDEAHCISHWGHDFRKSYMNIPEFINNLKTTPIISAFTATATEEVQHDIEDKLNMGKTELIVRGFDRENLFFRVVKGVDKDEYIEEYIEKNIEKSGIIYCATRKECDRLEELLSKKGVSCGKYHAGMKDNERKEVQEKFVYDELKIIVATNAFGMGIDKSNVRYVIHYNMPKDLESYYQEAGRAGRDGSESECILLYAAKDIIIQRFLIEKSDIETSEELINHKLAKLQDIIDYCNTSKCLREYILNYFGENDTVDFCGKCENCMESDLIDVTTESKMIISCVGRVKESSGINGIAMTITGSKNKEILRRGFDKISTYGIMKEYKLKDVKNIINLLVADGYLDISNGEFPVIKLNKKSFELLKDENIKIMKKVIKIDKKVEINESLFDKLKELRYIISKEENVPPYIIFNDKTLKEISEKVPRTRAEFLKISGVGEIKYEKYGKRFLGIIEELKDEVNNEKTILNNEKKHDKKSSNELSYEMHMQGKSFKEIAEMRELTENTVISHILDMALTGKEVNYSKIFNEKEERIILSAIDEVGNKKLKPIKEMLPETISYDKIKAVIIKNFNKI